jgi:uncharacterized membrane protein YGL010W
MKSLAQQMAVYSACHRSPWNKFAHAFGVPLADFAVLLALSWLRLPLADAGSSVAPFATAAVWAYYVMLDMGLAVAMVPVVVFMLYFADALAAHASQLTNASVFVTTFVLGVVLQLAGHAVEGRRSALVGDLRQVLIAPVFLLAEAGFKLGLRRGLKEEIERISRDSVETDGCV